MSRPALRWLGQALVRADRIEDADAVVVLGGAPRARTPEAVALLRAGRAQVVVCVGGLAGQAAEAWRTHAALVAQGVSPHRIIVVEAAAPGTADEARVAVALAQQRGWGRLLVVTSPYHTWRAGQLFDRRVRSAGLDVRMVPTTHDCYDPDGWWRTARQRRLVRNEVVKHAWWTITLRRR